MNPILLKRRQFSQSGDRYGRPLATVEARDYYRRSLTMAGNRWAGAEKAQAEYLIW